jgi:hypothetical protein
VPDCFFLKLKEFVYKSEILYISLRTSRKPLLVARVRKKSKCGMWMTRYTVNEMKTLLLRISESSLPLKKGKIITVLNQQGVCHSKHFVGYKEKPTRHTPYLQL